MQKSFVREFSAMGPTPERALKELSNKINAYLKANPTFRAVSISQNWMRNTEGIVDASGLPLIIAYALVLFEKS